MKAQSLKLSNIVITFGLQTRCQLDPLTIAEYAEAMTAGAKFPPVTVFHSREDDAIFLADGFHRYRAAEKAGFLDILADVIEGDRSQALVHALGSNQSHGLRRSNADKRRCVEMALEQWPKQSSREIAKLCGVGHTMVDEFRKQLASDASSPSETSSTPINSRIGADGKVRQMPAAKPAQSESAPNTNAQADLETVISEKPNPKVESLSAKTEVELESPHIVTADEEKNQQNTAPAEKDPDRQAAAIVWDDCLKAINDAKKYHLMRRLQSEFLPQFTKLINRFAQEEK